MKSILTTSASIKVGHLLTKEVPLAIAKQSYTPYAINIINLFNPQNSYTQYVVPAVFILILQQTLLIGLGILGGGINEGKEKRYNYYPSSPTWMVILSRIVIFTTIFIFNMMFTLDLFMSFLM